MSVITGNGPPKTTLQTQADGLCRFAYKNTNILDPTLYQVLQLRPNPGWQLYDTKRCGQRAYILKTEILYNLLKGVIIIDFTIMGGGISTRKSQIKYIVILKPQD